MKNVILTICVAYAVLLAAPQSRLDAAQLLFRSSLFFAKLGVILAPAGDWYDDDKGYDAGKQDDQQFEQEEA